MISQSYELLRYDADEGKVFDWKDLAAHVYKDKDDNEIQKHLYAKTIFLGIDDSIDNYEEVIPNYESEMVE